jgi:peptidyl-prolyl cis-trans isomerase D
MLISLRSKGASWIVKILFGLLIISFGFWGIPDTFRRFQWAPVAATVGGTDITADQLKKAVDFETKRLQKMYGNQVQPEQLRQLGLVDRALDGLVEPTLLQSYATDLGMAVPDDMLDKAIKTNPSLRDSTGNFNPQMLDLVLRERGWTQEEFADVTRRNILTYQFLRAITVDAHAPRSLTKTLYAYRAEQRIAHILAIPDSSITDVATPDDAAIAQFHKDNADRYQAPEYRAVTLVRLDPEDYAKKYSISDEAAKKEYDSRQSEFQIPEKRAIVQAVLPDETAAKALADKVRGGTPFADAVTAATSDGPVDVGTFAEDDLQKRLADVFSDETAGRQAAESLFAAAVGDVTDPVKGPIGWHVLSVTDIKPANIQPLDDDLRAKLKHALAVRQAIDELVDVANQLDDELGGGATLADAAGKIGLPVTKIDGVDSTGKDPDGKEVAAVTRDQGQALQLALKTDEGEDSLLTDMPNGGYVILHVDGVKPAATRPLETVRDKVIADWQEAERKKAADAKAQAIAGRIGSGVEQASDGGESIGKIAHELGVPVLISQPLTRDGSDPTANVGNTLVEKLFAAKVGSAVADRAPADNASVVAVLVEIRPADVDASGAEVDKLQHQLDQSIGGDLYEQFSADLKQKIGVSRNQDVVDSLYAK